MPNSDHTSLICSLPLPSVAVVVVLYYSIFSVVYKCLLTRAIAGFSNHSRQQKDFSIIVQFPYEIRPRWKILVKELKKFSVDTARVRSDHFTDRDYIRVSKSELLNLPCKRMLKPDSVPHIKFPAKTQESVALSRPNS